MLDENMLSKIYGKTIKSVALEDNELIIRFIDGTVLRLWDAGQSCCEDRYMRTDDDLPYYSGADLVGNFLMSKDYKKHLAVVTFFICVCGLVGLWVGVKAMLTLAFIWLGLDAVKMLFVRR